MELTPDGAGGVPRGPSGGLCRAPLRYFPTEPFDRANAHSGRANSSASGANPAPAPALHPPPLPEFSAVSAARTEHTRKVTTPATGFRSNEPPSVTTFLHVISPSPMVAPIVKTKKPPTYSYCTILCFCWNCARCLHGAAVHNIFLNAKNKPLQEFCFLKPGADEHDYRNQTMRRSFADIPGATRTRAGTPPHTCSCAKVAL